MEILSRRRAQWCRIWNSLPLPSTSTWSLVSWWSHYQVILEGANPDVVVSVTVARGMGGLVKAQRMVDPKGKDKGPLA